MMNACIRSIKLILIMSISAIQVCYIRLGFRVDGRKFSIHMCNMNLDTVRHCYQTSLIDFNIMPETIGNLLHRLWLPVYLLYNKCMQRHLVSGLDFRGRIRHGNTCYERPKTRVVFALATRMSRNEAGHQRCGRGNLK
jgi:hypothetical protein